MAYSILKAVLGLLTTMMLIVLGIGLLPTFRTWRRKIKFVGIAWVAALLPWAYITRQITPRSVGLDFIEPAPKAMFVLADGRKVSLDQLRGKAVLLDFCATWCLPCRASSPVVESIAQSRNAEGLVVIGVSVDTDERAWRQYLAAHPSSKLELMDTPGTIAAQFNSPTVPSFVLIDRQGRLRWKLMGWTPYSRWIMGRQVRKILSESASP
jgi:thiol-disulfide isomerase/thioredoxin